MKYQFKQIGLFGVACMAATWPVQRVGGAPPPLPSDLMTHVGRGVVPVTVNTSLLSKNPGGRYHHAIGSGTPTPWLLADNAVAISPGPSLSGLGTTAIVVSPVPETGTWGAAVGLALLIGVRWHASRSNSRRENADRVERPKPRSPERLDPSIRRVSDEADHG